MTSGERMVWAAEFVRARAIGMPVRDAIQSATEAAEELCTARVEAALTVEARIDLEDMLSNGADR